MVNIFYKWPPRGLYFPPQQILHHSGWWKWWRRCLLTPLTKHASTTQFKGEKRQYSNKRLSLYAFFAIISQMLLIWSKQTSKKKRKKKHKQCCLSFLFGDGINSFFLGSTRMLRYCCCSLSVAAPRLGIPFWRADTPLWRHGQEVLAAMPLCHQTCALSVSFHLQR